MIRQRVSLAVAGAIVATTALTAGMASPASAATSPYDPSFIPDSSTDLVGVGSDTIEIVMDYLSKGHGADVGFNFEKSDHRVASWAANDGVNPTSTISLRDAHAAVTRPNGSGAGKNELRLPATNGNTDVNFARSSSTLSAAEKTAGLQQYPFAVDGLKLAVSNSVPSHAPAIITPAQMVQIYSGAVTNWSQIGGTNGIIKPYVPQAGSGTLSYFTTQLTTANGGTPVTLAGTVLNSQEHDPAVIQNDPDAVAPFSTARAKTLPGTPVKVTKGFKAYRPVYNVVRGTDITNPTVLAFFGEDGFICSSDGRDLIEAAGFDALAHTDDGGVCGVPTQDPTSNFTSSSVVATDTSLVAESKNANKVKLTASVDASSDPDGTIQFKDGAANLGTPEIVVDGQVTKNLNLVPTGAHAYSAVFTPDTAFFTGSTSDTATIEVKTPSQVSIALLPSAGTYGSSRFVVVQATVDGEIPADGQSVNIQLDGNTPAVVPLINGSGAAFYTLPGTTALGAHTLTATLSGVGFTTASNAASLSVTQATTSTSIRLSSVKIKKKKRITAFINVGINGSSGPAANGTVQVFAKGKLVGQAAVTNGVAAVATTKFTKKGKFNISAVFLSGSPANYTNSASGAVRLTVK